MFFTSSIFDATAGARSESPDLSFSSSRERFCRAGERERERAAAGLREREREGMAVKTSLELIRRR